ncbi:uncharacterized protein LOC124941369 [Impatiens glandulifera]|uniref:uncharacterized protein LOC124941369 n=1 Tax=Impatiens glandulifera TaxID=253017 RepID=UPI001FB08FFE|nr:uncharacterized protein LOC124941369 [Impatiens glandulifera]
MSASSFLSRLSPTLRSASSKLNKCHSFSESPILNSISQSSASLRRIPRSSRIPVELSCLMTMLPLHSAIASARLQSMLSLESQCWGLVPQGISMPL